MADKTPKKNPNAVNLGRLGGKAKVPKGFGTMDKKKRAKLLAKSAATRKAKAAKKRAGDK